VGAGGEMTQVLYAHMNNKKKKKKKRVYLQFILQSSAFGDYLPGQCCFFKSIYNTGFHFPLIPKGQVFFPSDLSHVNRWSINQPSWRNGLSGTVPALQM
jgi:hypothetical protein